MKGIRESGIVVALNGDRASIRIRPASEDACANCGSCGQADAEGARILETAAAADLAVGDRVLVETAPINRVAASLLLLLVPLLGLLAGAIAGQAGGPGVGIEAETGAILGGLGALVVTYAAVTGFDRWIRKRRGDLGPRIISIRPEASP